MGTPSSRPPGLRPPEVAPPEPATQKLRRGRRFRQKKSPLSLEDGGEQRLVSPRLVRFQPGRYLRRNYPTGVHAAGAAITEVSPALPSEQDSIDFSDRHERRREAHATGLAVPLETPADARFPATASAAGVPSDLTEAAISAEAAAIAQQQPQPQPQPQAADPRLAMTKLHGSGSTEFTPAPAAAGRGRTRPGLPGQLLCRISAGYRTNLDTFTSVYGSQDDLIALDDGEESLAKCRSAATQVHHCPIW